MLDQLESAARDESITVEEVVKKLGRKSFASLMLVFSLISTSPASAHQARKSGMDPIRELHAGQQP